MNLKEYILNIDTLKDPYMHVRNQHFQIHNKSFGNGFNYDDQYGDAWTLKGLEKYFIKNNLNY